MRISSLGLLAMLFIVSACDRGDTTPSQAAGGVPLVESFLATSAALSPYQTGRSYTVNDVTYEPVEDFTYAATGTASYYSNGLDGALTASGETYFSNEYTAAHKTLPFQTLVRVTHVETGESVIVRINDRGPFVEGRVIDLSGRAAADLGIIEAGLATVQLQVLETETRMFSVALKSGRVIPISGPINTLAPGNETVAPAVTTPTITTPIQETASGGFFVLVGTYTSQVDANAIRDRMAGLGAASVEPSAGLFRVIIGPLASRLDAQAVLGRVFAQGATNATVIQR